MNLTRIRGIQRGAASLYSTVTASGISSGGAGPASVRGFRVPLALGRHYKQNTTAATSFLSSGTLLFKAEYPGSFGNDLRVGLIVASGTYSEPVISVSTISGTAAYQVIAFCDDNESAFKAAQAINSHPQAGQLLNVTVASGYTNSSTVFQFNTQNLANGSNGSGTQDREPGPQTGNVAGEPIFAHVTNRTTWVVDTDDQVAARVLFRNKWRWLPLGSA